MQTQFSFRTKSLAQELHESEHRRNKESVRRLLDDWNMWWAMVDCPVYFLKTRKAK